MYDHNQTLVPDSFLALYSRHGRPTLSRADTEARYEACEEIALHAAAFLASQHPGEGHDDAERALQNCYRGLRAEPLAMSDGESRWVTRRVAELQEWPGPTFEDAV